MHWLVGYLCHTRGPQNWLVDDGAVQAHNVPWAAIPSMGESWHNNHHAFPASAGHGLYPGERDIGFGFLQLLERLGCVWHIQTPDVLPPRNALQRFASVWRHDRTLMIGCHRAQGRTRSAERIEVHPSSR
jgi:sn-1 stearoyl-lipid 9-desaturase